MTRKIIEPLDLKFPKGEHEDCRALTAITIEHLSADDSLGKLIKIPRRGFVWQIGDRSDKIYFLKEGRIGIVGTDREGREVILGMIVAGDPFGELCFCDGPTAQRSTIAKATMNCLALEVTIDDFVAYMQRDKKVLGSFLFTFCIRLAHAEKRIAILALRGVEERLGHSLLHLAKSRGVLPHEAGQSEEFILSITHEELSGLTAMSRQRVSMAMNRFRRLGLVRYSRTEPLVVKVNSLAEYLHEIL